jgi:N-methylhydantoinase A
VGSFRRRQKEDVLRLATDIGGTFTDLVYMDPESNTVGFAKAASTPPDFETGILDAMNKAPVTPESVTTFVHGCTIVINALTERKGARTALVTTAGFRDVLEIGRANRPDLYNMKFEKQPPFIPREWRLEVDERMNFRGEVQIPLSAESVTTVAQTIRDENIEAVAVCFLHSYLNSSHEEECARMLREQLPGVFISTSAEISKEWREYERTSTVALNSYVQPITTQYLENLESSLRGLGLGSGLHAMKSNGGTNTFAVSKEQPIHLVESGPVGGVIGAKVIGDSIGTGNLITLDVGGTTAKTSLIEDGEVKFTTEYKIERDPFHAGYPIKVPVVDIVEIGAGGGSIAWVDKAGALNIGPHSAGAVPGPACYGAGGTDPTVTDANLVAGRINPDYYLGGEITVQAEASRRSLQPIADSFSVSVEEAALGVIRVADGNMINAIKLVSVRRGYDPRDFALVACGGGGPMHAGALARELQIGKVIVPISPGTFSAWGMLVAEPKQDFIQTSVIPGTPAHMAQVDETYKTIEQEATAFLEAAGYPLNKSMFVRYADMRYLGQEHTVRVPVDTLDFASIDARFHAAHEQAYTFRLDTPVEFVALQITAVVRQPAPDLSNYAPNQGASLTPKGTRQVYFEEGAIDAAIYERRDLPTEVWVDGPAIIEEPSSTSVVHPEQRACVDKVGNLVLETEV